MFDERPPLRTPYEYRVLVAGCLLHALLVLALWLATFVGVHVPISGPTWLALAWLWVAWPIAIALRPGRSVRRVTLPTLAGAVILAPCVLVIYTFTVWAVQGFAP